MLYLAFLGPATGQITSVCSLLMQIVWGYGDPARENPLVFAACCSGSIFLSILFFFLPATASQVLRLKTYCIWSFLNYVCMCPPQGAPDGHSLLELKLQEVGSHLGRVWELNSGTSARTVGSLNHRGISPALHFPEQTGSMPRNTPPSRSFSVTHNGGGRAMQGVFKSHLEVKGP